MSVLALGLAIPNLPGIFGWNGCNVRKPQLLKLMRMFSVTKVKDYYMIVLNEDKLGRKSDSFLLQVWDIKRENYANHRERFFSSRWNDIFFIDQIVAWTDGPFVRNILIRPFLVPIAPQYAPRHDVFCNKCVWWTPGYQHICRHWTPETRAKHSSSFFWRILTGSWNWSWFCNLYIESAGWPQIAPSLWRR